MNTTTKTIIISAVVAIVFFIGGTAYGKHRSAKTALPGGQMQFGQGRMNGGTARGGMGGLVSGTVISKDANGLTIQSQTGSKIVIVSPSTTVAKSTQGSLDDVTVGSTVTVIGASNADGSVTAQSVQLRPEGQARP